MFCSSCGKEIGEEMRFCPSCGTRADEKKAGEDSAKAWADLPNGDEGSVKAWAEDAGGQRDASKIEVREDFDELAQMTRKVRKSEKTWSMIGKVLAVCILLWTGWGMLGDIVSIAEGKVSVWYPALRLAVIVLVSCGMLHLYLKIVLPGVNARKNNLAGEYLKLISVNDSRDLMKALGQMRCSVIKSAYLDENGNACVQGRCCKHTFLLEEGELIIRSGKDNYKAALEKETIAGWLLKSLSPDAPVNAYENERYNIRLSKLNRVLAIVAAVSGGIVIAVFAVQPEILQGTDKYIRCVQSGYPELYPDISYGDAFSDFFENCRWKYFKSKDNRDVVEFHGNCLSGEKKTDVGVQFVVDYDGGTFELYSVSVDGEPQIELFNNLFILSIFERYGSNDGMGTLPDEARVEGKEADSLAQPEQKEEQAESQAAAKEQEQSENLPARSREDLFYPILCRGYADGYNPCPVMVNEEVSGELAYGSWGDMMESLWDDAETMYAPPMMQDGKIYTSTRWDAFEEEWYNGLLTQEQFLEAITWIETVYEESGALDIYSGGSWEDVDALSGRWAGGNQEIAISIYSDISYCPAYSEIGVLELGTERALGYMIGTEGSDVYVYFLFDSGEELYLRYRGDGTAQAWAASDGCPIEMGTQFACVEKFES